MILVLIKEVTARFSVILLFLLLDITVDGQAQDNHVFKIGISNVAHNQYFIGYERRIVNAFSFNVEVGLLKKAFYMETIDRNREIAEVRTDQTKHSTNFRFRTKAKIGYQFNLEARYRPGKELSEGLYLGIKTGYQYVDFGQLEVSLYDLIFDAPRFSKIIDVEQHSWLMGGTVGFNFKISDSLSLDLNIFSGYVFVELIDPEELEFIPYAEPAVNIFRSYHRAPIDQLRLGVNVFLVF